MVLSVVSAALGMLIYPPVGAYALAFIFLIPLFLFLSREKRLLRLVAGSFMFRLVLVSYVAIEAFEPILYAQSLVIFLGLPVSVWILKRASTSATIQNIALPVLFTVWEYAQARFTLLPFFRADIGVNLAPSPFLGLARWGGAPLLTLFVATVNLLLLAVLMRSGIAVHRRPFRFAINGASGAGRKLLLAAAWTIALGLVISQLSLRARAADYRARSHSLHVALISTAPDFDAAAEDLPDAMNGTDREWVAAFIDERFRRIADALNDDQFDLIAFPEELFRNDYVDDQDAEAREKFGIINAGTPIRAYRAFAREHHSNVLAYLTTITQNGKRFNAGMLFSTDGTIVSLYEKHYLAYTGETWPFGSWRPFYLELSRKAEPTFGRRTPVFDQRYAYDEGSERQLLSLPGGTRFATPICSEIHYPHYVSQLVRAGAQFVVNSSSNNWVRLGLSKYLESVMHLRQIEAIQTGVPILINGRRDYAGMVTPDGAADIADFNAPEGFAIYRGEIRL